MKIRRFFLACSIVLFILGICKNSDVVHETFAEAMSQYLYRLLPVLFPYMVIARLLVSQKLLSSVSEVLPLHRVFRLPDSVMPVFWLGNLCGFPIGAQLTGILRKEEKISPEDAGRLCAVSGNVSPAFVVQVAGGLLWGDVGFGVFLLLVQFISCCVFGILLGRNTVRGDEKYLLSDRQVSEGFGTAFCRAITESAAGCVTLCGYIVFFSVLLAVLPLEGVWKALIAGILEFTAGVDEAVRFGGMTGLFFTGFSVGFGGICVLAQVSYALGNCGISLKGYFLGKCFQGIVCGLASVVYGFCFPALYKGDTVRSTLQVYAVLPDGIVKFVFPLLVVCMAGIHYSLYFRFNSVNSDNSSSN